MAVLIGTDEAGYGPNLGPLTIGATLWNVPHPSIDLYQALLSAVSPRRSVRQLMVADSKKVYQSGQTIKTLEETVLSFLGTMHRTVPSRFGDLSDWLGLQLTGQERCFETLADFPLPVCAERTVIQDRIGLLQTTFEESECFLVGLRAAAIFPSGFNRAVMQLGNKAEVLSRETLLQISQFFKDGLPEGEADILIGCDKHGGRSKYAGLLNQYLTSDFVQIVEESTACSEYRWRKDDSDVAIRFAARGEQFLPIALASMVAKYIREIAMMAWNIFWSTEIPGIKPTKGYPLDAKRFKKDIYETQLNLGIVDHQIWRCR